jgi:hypothetical protein
MGVPMRSYLFLSSMKPYPTTGVLLSLARRICLQGKNVSIMASLHSGLHHLRRQDTTRVMWIDQLCINRDDSVKKGIQVNLCWIRIH